MFLAKELNDSVYLLLKECHGIPHRAFRLAMPPTFLGHAPLSKCGGA